MFCCLFYYYLYFCITTNNSNSSTSSSKGLKKRIQKYVGQPSSIKNGRFNKISPNYTMETIYGDESIFSYDHVHDEKNVEELKTGSTSKQDTSGLQHNSSSNSLQNDFYDSREASKKKSKLDTINTKTIPLGEDLSEQPSEYSEKQAEDIRLYNLVTTANDLKKDIDNEWGHIHDQIERYPLVTDRQFKHIFKIRLYKYVIRKCNLEFFIEFNKLLVELLLFLSDIAIFKIETKKSYIHGTKLHRFYFYIFKLYKVLVKDNDLHKYLRFNTFLHSQTENFEYQRSFSMLENVLIPKSIPNGNNIKVKQFIKDLDLNSSRYKNIKRGFNGFYNIILNKNDRKVLYSARYYVICTLLGNYIN